MVEDTTETEEAPAVITAGQKLREAREAAGLDLAHVAAQTRITQRHLLLIEEGKFDQLPGRTYAVGFSRSYARVIGLDDAQIAAQVREELTGLDLAAGRAVRTFEPGDPARVPTRRLTWFSVLAAVILLAGGSAYLWQNFVSPSFSLPSLLGNSAPAPGTRPQQAPPPAAPAQPSGAVVFTSTEADIWVKFYDAQGKQLMQKQMAQNESWTVPADALGPMIWTGRPDALTFTIGGTPMGRLGDERGSIRDVPVTAQGLLARIEAASAQATASASPAIPARATAPVRRTRRAGTQGDYTPQQTAGDEQAPLPTSSPTTATTPTAPTPAP